eukprot:3652815-Rhodomonas_salina.2
MTIGYALFDTEAAYGATAGLSSGMASYAIPCTDIPSTLRPPYAIPGTDIAPHSSGKAEEEGGREGEGEGGREAWRAESGLPTHIPLYPFPYRLALPPISLALSPYCNQPTAIPLRLSPYSDDPLTLPLSPYDRYRPMRRPGTNAW